MNGYDAQDMAAQGADGFRNGYQAGYADAVKAIEAAQPAAAQEAVATVESFTNGSYHRNYKLRWHKNVDAGTQLFAAPVTAAPADLIERCREILAWQRTGVLPGDALRAYANARWPDEHDPLQIAEKETAREAFRILARAAAAITPAAPGIDLAALAAKITDHLCEQDYDIGGRDELLQHVREAIDASPKGAEAQQAAAQAMVIALTDGYRWNGQRWQRYSPDGALIEHFGAAEGLGSTTTAARSIRAPAGWALVPDRMQLTPENMELLADTLRGADEDEPWCGGVLWIGQTTDDDGEPTYYGLNVGNVECLEEGSINIVEFDPPADSPKGGSEARDAVLAALVEAATAVERADADGELTNDLVDRLRADRDAAQASSHGAGERA